MKQLRAYKDTVMFLTFLGLAAAKLTGNLDWSWWALAWPYCAAVFGAFIWTFSERVKQEESS